MGKISFVPNSKSFEFGDKRENISFLRGNPISHLKLLVGDDLADVLEYEVAGLDLVLGANAPALVLSHELLQTRRPLVALDALVLAFVSVDQISRFITHYQVLMKKLRPNLPSTVWLFFFLHLLKHFLLYKPAGRFIIFN